MITYSLRKGCGEDVSWLPIIVATKVAKELS
jgi:hypothetical protein